MLRCCLQQVAEGQCHLQPAKVVWRGCPCFVLLLHHVHSSMACLRSRHDRTFLKVDLFGLCDRLQNREREDLQNYFQVSFSSQHIYTRGQSWSWVLCPDAGHVNVELFFGQTEEKVSNNFE